MKRSILLLFTAFLWLAPSLDAAAFRCGNDLVDKGDLMIEVRQHCGEPTSVQSWEEVRVVHTRRFGYFFESLQTVPVEEWVYNLGPNDFIRIVRFEKGEVVEVRTGDYGF